MHTRLIFYNYTQKSHMPERKCKQITHLLEWDTPTSRLFKGTRHDSNFHCKQLYEHLNCLFLQRELQVVDIPWWGVHWYFLFSIKRDHSANLTNSTFTIAIKSNICKVKYSFYAPQWFCSCIAHNAFLLMQRGCSEYSSNITPHATMMYIHDWHIPCLHTQALNSGQI